jgi:hypothetical protein
MSTSSIGSRTRHVASVRVAARPANVFALLCPIREREFIEGWQCDLIFAESGGIEREMIVTTAGTGSQARIWFVADHDPAARYLRYVVIEPGLWLRTLEVRVEGHAEAACTLTAVSTVTCMTPAASSAVAGFTAEALDEDLRAWGRELESAITAR